MPGIAWFALGVLLAIALVAVAVFLDYLRFGSEQEPPEVTRLIAVVTAVVTSGPPQPAAPQPTARAGVITRVVTPVQPEPIRTPEAPSGTADLGTPENPILMAFLPMVASRTTAEGDPLAVMLRERTGLTVETIAFTSYVQVREALMTGDVHVGWLTALHYIVASEQHGVDVGIVAIKLGSPSFQGQIVANAETGIASLADVRGKAMCWVDPNSVSGYILPRIRLLAGGIDPDSDLGESITLGSHHTVITAVYNADCEAGASYVDAREELADQHPDVMERVLVIATTAPVPNDGLCFSRAVPAETRATIVDALLAIAASEEGSSLLEELYSIEALEPGHDGMYEPLRAEIDAAGVDVRVIAGQ